MIPAPARYLLRFDDLCPAVHRERWQCWRTLIAEFALQPILAAVPDNCDPALDVALPDPGFWNHLFDLQSAGATIGLHGYRHLCVSRGRSLLGLHRASEFAGVPEKTQQEWIAAGLRILRGHGLSPSIFVAPRHGFDEKTLLALRAEGIALLSDGFARTPFLRRGVTWIPQQLWGPLDKPSGVWTICIHPNTAGEEDLANLRGFLRAHSDQFVSVDRLLAEIPPATLALSERVYACVALWRAKASRARARLPRLGRGSSNSA